MHIRFLAAAPILIILALVVPSPSAPTATPNGAHRRGDVTAARYGAKGDGVTDDAPAIQAALDAEGRAFLPPGTYRLGSRVQVTRSGGGVVGAGAGSTVLKPDASLTTGTLSVLSPSNDTLTDVEITGFTLDGSADPAKVQGIGVFNCKRVRVHGISPVRISGMIHLEAVENFTIEDIAGSELIEFISLNTVRKGVISNIRVDGADEGIDFYNGEDVEVVGVVITARDPLVIKPHPYSAGVDLSSSRRVTIANSTFSGHYTGIHVKQESGAPGGPPVEDILITNCQIRDYITAGIYLSVAEGRGCRIQGCDIRTTRKDASGIYAFRQQTCYFNDLVIADCSIDSTHSGIRFNSYNGAEIRDCRITAGTSHAVNVYECSDLTVTGCRLRSPRESALFLAGVVNPLVQGCDVAGAAGVWVTDCRRPTVRRNIVGRTDGRAISIAWTGERMLDATNRVAGFVVDENVVRNWGRGSAGNPAITVSFSGISGAPYQQGSVCGNRLLLDGDAKPNAQSGIAFEPGSLASIDWVKVDSNLIHGTYAGITGAEALGANSTTANNTFKQNLR